MTKEAREEKTPAAAQKEMEKGESLEYDVVLYKMVNQNMPDAIPMLFEESERKILAAKVLEFAVPSLEELLEVYQEHIEEKAAADSSMENEEEEKREAKNLPAKAVTPRAKASASSDDSGDDQPSAKEPVTLPLGKSRGDVMPDTTIVAEHDKRREENLRKTLFVKGLPRRFTVEGCVNLHPLVKNTRLKPNRSFAWLHFATETDAEKAYTDLWEKEMAGVPLFVDYCGSKSSSHQKMIDEKKTDRPFNPLRLCVRQLPESVTKNSLALVFNSALEIVIPPLFKKERGRFALLTFKTVAEAKTAFDKGKDLKLFGHPVTVLYALQKGPKKSAKADSDSSISEDEEEEAITLVSSTSEDSDSDGERPLEAAQEIVPQAVKGAVRPEKKTVSPSSDSSSYDSSDSEDDKAKKNPTTTAPARAKSSSASYEIAASGEDQPPPAKTTVSLPVNTAMQGDGKREEWLNKNLLVKGFPHTFQKSDLMKLHPLVKKVQLNLKGTQAWLRFSTEADAMKAHSSLEKKEYGGASLFVDFCGEKSTTQQWLLKAKRGGRTATAAAKAPSAEVRKTTVSPSVADSSHSSDEQSKKIAATVPTKAVAPAKEKMSSSGDSESECDKDKETLAKATPTPEKSAAQATFGVSSKSVDGREERETATQLVPAMVSLGKESSASSGSPSISPSLSDTQSSMESSLANSANLAAEPTGGVIPSSGDSEASAGKTPPVDPLNSAATAERATAVTDSSLPSLNCEKWTEGEIKGMPGRAQGHQSPESAAIPARLNRVFYREAPNTYLHGPFSESKVQAWYRGGWFHSQVEFWLGDGPYYTLAELRHLNGPACPFAPITRETTCCEEMINQLEKKQAKMSLGCWELEEDFKWLTAEVNRLRRSNEDLQCEMRELREMPQSVGGSGRDAPALAESETAVQWRQQPVKETLPLMQSVEEAVAVKAGTPLANSDEGEEEVAEGGGEQKEHLQEQHRGPLPLLSGSRNIVLTQKDQELMGVLLDVLKECLDRREDWRGLIMQNAKKLFTKKGLTCPHCHDKKLPTPLAFLSHCTSQKHLAKLSAEGRKLRPADFEYWLYNF